MSAREINLSRRPFVNERPVRRISLLLWIAGGALALANAIVYTQYFSGDSFTRDQQIELRRAIELEEERIADLRKALDRLELARQNEKAQFFNQLIKQRTFSWSRLFDDLAATLPEDVRLAGLAPRFAAGETSRRRRRVGPAADEVLLQIQGAAKSGEALLELVDALFAAPAFRRPDLSQEAVEEGQLSNFDLTVIYMPEAAAAAAVPEAEPAPAADAVAEAAGPADGP